VDFHAGKRTSKKPRSVCPSRNRSFIAGTRSRVSFTPSPAAATKARATAAFAHAGHRTARAASSPKAASPQAPAARPIREWVIGMATARTPAAAKARTAAGAARRRPPARARAKPSPSATGSSIPAAAAMWLRFTKVPDTPEPCPFA
jgi:hypothetical protein